MKRIGILCSGGDAPGMNSALRAVVRSAIFEGIEVFGIKNGYEGLIDGSLVPMIESSVADIIQKGGTILGTSRSERFRKKEGVSQALNVLKVYGIEGLIVLGGDGSMRGAYSLYKEGFPVGLIPCSIDNDMDYTDYTVGFWTAVDTVTDAISKIRDTTDAHNRANVVEVMGRNCGDIALYAGISGGAESILVPENKADIDDIARKMLMGKNRGKRHHIILVAEGLGHAHEIAEELQKITEIETRVTILGYIQRGGSPSSVDRVLASAMGNILVKKMIENDENKALAVGIRNGQIFTEDFERAFNRKKVFSKNLYDIMKIVSI